MRWTAAVLAPVAAAALAGAVVQAHGATPSPAAQVFSDAGCVLCHGVPAALPEVAAASRQDSCTGCHIWIREVAADPPRRDKARAIFPLWDRYERNVASYMSVPSLDAALARLEPAWVDAYLRDPHDLRPNLPETMPRFHLDDAQMQALTALFSPVAVPEAPRPRRRNVAAGQALFTERGCAACHTFGANAVGALPMAPDLAYARERLSADMAVAWIDDPRAVSPAATMPDLGVTREEAVLIRDYLWLSDTGATLPPPATDAPTALNQPVAWAEVEEQVFGKICVHCHMNPELNNGRRGPGNAGGFGWPETGIELQTPEGVAAAADRIPDALLRRRHEARRDAVSPGQRAAEIERPARPGMPLGLPPIPDEDIALVLAWIEQGMPR